MPTRLRLLLVDESRDDAGVLLREMEEDGFAVDCRRVDSEAALREALRSRWDLVVSEREVRGLPGDRVCSLVKRHNPDVPFLFVCDAFGGEWAVQAMRAGAQDCLSKGNLGRLGDVVARELHEAERQRAELAATHARHTTECIEAVGRAAGVMAHDFNNLLTVIRGYAGLLMDTLPPNADATADLECIDQAAEAAEAITRRLLAFSGRMPSHPETFCLNDLLRWLEERMRLTLADNVSLHLSLADDLWPVCMDPVHFEQVALSLTDNARDAMPDGGELWVETVNVPAGVEHVSLKVRDTGHGMTADVRRHVFEPFFTTRDRGRGAGLGLSIVHGLVRQAGGGIEIASEPGRGTTIEILFPRHAGP